jgi:hypothetical protein
LFFKDIKIKRKEQINHPGREMNLVKIRKSIVPATPPSKGGETFSNHLIYNYTVWLTAIDGGMSSVNKKTETTITILMIVRLSIFQSTLLSGKYSHQYL